MPKLKKKVTSPTRSFGITVFLILCFVFSASTVYAQKALVILKDDKTKVYYSLDNNPKIVFDGGWLKVYQENGNDNFAVNDMDRIDIESLNQSSLPGIEADNISIASGMLVVDSTNELLSYSIVNLQGVVLQSGSLGAGRNIIDLRNLVPDVYLVNIGTETLKIAVK